MSPRASPWSGSRQRLSCRYPDGTFHKVLHSSSGRRRSPGAVANFLRISHELSALPAARTQVKHRLGELQKRKRLNAQGGVPWVRPRRKAAAPLECDIVMAGGVTSGGIYPGVAAIARASRMQGMLSAAELSALHQASGGGFDRLFVDLMTKHHEGSIGMADEATRNAGDPRLVLMAYALRHAQRGEVSLMQGSEGAAAVKNAIASLFEPLRLSR
jgi:hypothetical protein